ncbi:glutaminase [Pseudoalteromonas phenolica]|uniref:Glutaminase n=1 Tax=Pseudoalteromonas phenolica TaxID=161398 RepID=A0A4Q7IPS7_9GAMM|nr:glutaminase B [Pseudoalteromonas phenolica]RZQ53456.1 glutaminase [Pseudoalteromonas phenolica]
MLNYQTLLEKTCQHVESFSHRGEVATYIPALAEQKKGQFAIALQTTDGKVFSAGDVSSKFTVQSVSKALTLTMALQRYGDDLWQRVGKEPSGTAFNSLTQLEFEQGKPRNPFINAGAIVTADALYSRLSAPIHAVLEKFRAQSGNSNVVINRTVANSEYQHRYRNAAMAYLMKSFGNFDNDVEKVLWSYFNYCAIEVNVIELAKTFSYLSNKGFCLQSGEQVLLAKQTKQLNSLLFTSGLYDAAGDFAYRVGMPGKSGVSGTIIAVLPGQFTAAVWSPGLDSYGNSVAGIAALEYLAEHINH